MKIEAGKRYVMRDGRVTAALFRSAIYPDHFEGFVLRNDGILGSYKVVWAPGGYAVGYAIPGPHDLICEYHGPKAAVTREWIKSEIATIERHLHGQPSQTLAALKLALERLDQIAAEKPKETIADKIANILIAGGDDAKFAAKRILGEVVAGIVEDAFHAGWKSHASGNGDTGPDYARRIINEECGDE